MANVLKKNSYLILGLDVSASHKEITKRGKEISGHLHIGDTPKYEVDLGIFPGLRTVQNVQAALQRLSMPKKKIIDTLFWFDLSDDVDKDAVESGNHLKAIEIWKKYLEEDTAKSLLHVKNLALLYTVLLFTNDGKHFLDDSLAAWEKIFNSDKFWKVFFNSFKLYHEIDINKDILLDLRKEAPKLLSDIYVDLASIHKDNNFIAKFQATFRVKGERVEKEVLHPIYEGIDEAVKNLEKMDISADGIFDDEEARELKENIKMIQDELNKALDAGLYDDSKVKLMRDRAADAIRTVVLDIHNNLQEYKKSIALLEIAKKIAGTGGMLKKIEDEKKAIEDTEHIQEVFTPIHDRLSQKDFEGALNEIKDKIAEHENNPKILLALNRNKKICVTSLAMSRFNIGKESFGESNFNNAEHYFDETREILEENIELYNINHDAINSMLDNVDTIIDKAGINGIQSIDVLRNDIVKKARKSFGESEEFFVLLMLIDCHLYSKAGRLLKAYRKSQSSDGGSVGCLIMIIIFILFSVLASLFE